MASIGTSDAPYRSLHGELRFIQAESLMLLSPVLIEKEETQTQTRTKRPNHELEDKPFATGPRSLITANKAEAQL